MQFLGLYAIAATLFVIIDAIWLSVVANKFYKDKLGHLLADKASLLPAVLFYAIFIVGLVFFVIKPGIEQGIGSTIVRGALFGLITYATYDLTNQATLKNWPVAVTVVDLIWGMVLSATICTLTVLIYRQFS